MRLSYSIRVAGALVVYKSILREAIFDRQDLATKLAGALQATVYKSILASPKPESSKADDSASSGFRAG
jgi:hypothetical protein